MNEIDNGKDTIINNKNKTIILTSTANQKNNEDENYISMVLGECENILKNNYNISSNDSLYILQVIIKEEGMKIPKVEYEVYYPLYDINNLIKLNLSSCKDTKIEISISVRINGSLDKYDPNSNYYNDICSKATSESGTDITLKDRKNEYVNNNMSLCEENCNLIKYDSEKGKAKCSCNVKLSVSPNYESKFDKNDFFKSFINFDNVFNINIMKCYKSVLKLKDLSKNYGFFIVGCIFVLYLFEMFYFIISSFSSIKKEINKIIFALKTIGNPIKKKKGQFKKKIDKKFLARKSIKNNNDMAFKLNLQKKDMVRKRDYIGQVTQNISDNTFNMMNTNKISTKGNNNKYINNILELKDFELNSLDYEEAFRTDKRNFCQYYFSLLKYNHPLLFSFGCYNDYNSKIIKMFLFFFSFCLDFAVNALFFTDDTMHKIYVDKGHFNFLYQLPQILYSIIISRFIDSFIKGFALSQDNIVELKQEKTKNGIEKKNKKLLCKIKFKFTLFFISALIVLLFLWFYITCFCGIYVNTQIHLIKDSIISLITSLLIPFVLIIIPTIFRISALSAEKPSRKCLYNFSLFVENWFC